MAEFTPINTQEELNSVIGDRLAKQEAKIRAEYADYETIKSQAESWSTEKQSFEQSIADGRTKFEELQSKYDEAVNQITEYKTEAIKTKIAIEEGLPMELRNYLKGNTEEEIKASAAELGKFAKGSQIPPLAHPESDPPSGDSSERSLRQVLKKLHE